MIKVKRFCVCTHYRVVLSFFLIKTHEIFHHFEIDELISIELIPTSFSLWSFMSTKNWYEFFFAWDQTLILDWDNFSR